MKKWITLELLYILIGAVIIISLLISGTFVGVADNGDFLRIMGTAGLNYFHIMESYEDRFFNYSHSLFAYDDFFRGFYPSTQIVLVILARGISLIGGSSSFDIRILGFLYASLLLTAGFLLIKYNKTVSLLTNILLTVLLLVIFMDIGYLAYFNSLYGEPVSYIFLMLVMALGLFIVQQKTPSRSILILFFLSMIFLVCSKTQNTPIGIGFAVIGLRYAWLKTNDANWRKLTIMLSLATFLLSCLMYVTAPKDFKQINMYQTVFFGILKDSPNVESDLKELGLPNWLSVLAGTNYFESGTAIKQNDPSLTEAFYNRISHMDVLQFYIKHPSRFLEKLEIAADNGMMIRPYYLGNFEKSEGKAPGAISFQYSSWSEFKKKYIPHSLTLIGIFFALYYAVLLYEWNKNREISNRIRVELFMLLGFIGIFSFVIPIVGDGQADIGKHLFLFNVTFDMMLVASITWLFYQIIRLKSRLKNKSNSPLLYK